MHSLGKSAGVLIALLIFSLPAWRVPCSANPTFTPVSY